MRKLSCPKCNAASEEEGRMELEALRRFVSVVDAGGIRAAAQASHVSASSISRSISHLETELGETLFDARREQLTKAGQIALPTARRIISDANKLRADVSESGSPEGTILISSCSPSPLWLLNDLASDKLPGTLLLGSVTTSSQEATLRLAAREVDLAITTQPIVSPFVESTRFMHEQLLACIPKRHPVARQDQCKLEDFACDTVLLFRGIGFWLDVLQDALGRANVIVQDDWKVFISSAQASDVIHFELDTPGMHEETERHVLVPVTNEAAQATYYANWYREPRPAIKQRLAKLGAILRTYAGHLPTTS